jgi:toxin ParE1/3/4
MAKYHLLNRAVDDLTEIWEYTFDEWSENQADNYYQFLIDSCLELAENSNLGKPYNQLANGLFGFTFGEHIIFYFIIELKEIEIVRILHGKMDLKKKF